MTDECRYGAKINIVAVECPDEEITEIIDFVATDNLNLKVKFSWTPLTNHDGKYNLLRNGDVIAYDISPGYIYNVSKSSYTYQIVTTRKTKLLFSNKDEGISLDIDKTPPIGNINLSASDNLFDKIVITFNELNANPEPTIMLFDDGRIVENNINSPYEIVYGEDGGTGNFYVIIENSEGYVVSNSDIGTAIGNTKPYEIFDFVATDEGILEVGFSWTNPIGYPEPTYDLYRDGILDKENINQDYVLADSGGTYDFYVVAKNTEGSTDSNHDSGTSLVPHAPIEIIDLNASDNDYNSVSIDFTPTTGIPNVIRYELYEDDILISDNIDTGYVHDVSPGTRDYYVMAINDIGSTKSNVDSGTSKSGTPPSYIGNLSATDDQIGQITITWSSSSGTPSPSHDLYRNGSRIKSNAGSGYIDNLPDGGTYDYYVVAVNDIDSTRSNTNSGTAEMLNVPPSYISDLSATDSQCRQITIYFTPVPEDTHTWYNLYQDGVNIAGDISPGYNDVATPNIWAEFQLNAASDYGNTSSNTDSGKANDCASMVDGLREGIYIFMGNTEEQEIHKKLTCEEFKKWADEVSLKKKDVETN